MNPIIILALVGTIGFVAWRLLSQDVKKQEGPKDPALGALDRTVSSVLDLLPQVITWADTKVPETFGYEGFDTLKGHSKVAAQIFRWRNDGVLSPAQVLAVLNGLNRGADSISEPLARNTVEHELFLLLKEKCRLPLKRTSSKETPFAYDCPPENLPAFFTSIRGLTRFQIGSVASGQSNQAWAAQGWNKDAKDWQKCPSVTTQIPGSISCYPGNALTKRGYERPWTFVTTYPAHTYLYVRGMFPRTDGWITGEDRLTEYFSPVEQAQVWSILLFGAGRQAFIGWDQKYKAVGSYWTQS